MTRSMTAFARAEHGAAVWEIRSVNHRYLDASFRMQDSFRNLEPELKNAFKNTVHRGKLECVLKIKSGEIDTELRLNEALLNQLKLALYQVEELTGLTRGDDALALMKWPDVLTTVEQTDDVAADVTTSFNTALQQLVEMREREGGELANLIESRLKDIETTVAALRISAPQVAEQQQQKLRKRLDELGVEVDTHRLEQELVIQAQKLDVMEELDRLATHVTEVRRSLASSEPVGRRLDFLMQELNREANTLSSKAQTSDATLHAVDLKVFIEQMREQIQNIE